MISNLTFITSNFGKVKLLNHYSSFPIKHQKLHLDEIQSLDIHYVVAYKAKEAYKQIKKPILVEDTALTITALNKLPGTLIKWFLDELGVEGICRLVDNYEDRSALAQVCYGLYNGRKIHYFEGKTHGKIADHAIGNKGIGWDAAFIPSGTDKTWGEMNEDEQEYTSMRRVALKKLGRFLKSYSEL